MIFMPHPVLDFISKLYAKRISKVPKIDQPNFNSSALVAVVVSV